MSLLFLNGAFKKSMIPGFSISFLHPIKPKFHGRMGQEPSGIWRSQDRIPLQNQVVKGVGISFFGFLVVIRSTPEKMN